VLDFVGALVRKTIDEYPIDPAQVTLTGLSSGGTACWELAIRNSDLFAAVAPVASNGTRTEGIERLANCPVWTFHSIHDSNLRSGVEDTVLSLRQSGGMVHLSAVDGNGHNCWTMAFEHYHLLDWLRAQQRGKSSWTHAPGSISVRGRLQNCLRGWTAWQLVAQIGIPFSLAMAIWFLRRRRPS
jgi:predicted peptidase